MAQNLLEKYKDYLNVATRLRQAYTTLEEAQTAFSTTFAGQYALFKEYSELQCLKLTLRLGEHPKAEIRKNNERIQQLESEAPWLKGKPKNSIELAEQLNVADNLLTPYLEKLHDISALKRQLIMLQAEISADLRDSDVPDTEKHEALSWSIDNLADITSEIQQRDTALVGEFQQNLLENTKFLAQQPADKFGKENYRAMFESENEADPAAKPAN